MQIDIKTSSVKPLRNTYAYIEKRFGDKPASRYQEATYDIQEEINFHYKPLWQPEFDLYDKGRTVIQMKDWYVLKDPRQFYYGAYTQTRAKQQEILESNFTLVEKHDLLRNISEEILNKVTKLLLPLYCKQDIFIFYIQWLIFLLIGNTMKNTMLRKGLTIFWKIAYWALPHSSIGRFPGFASRCMLFCSCS
ncbi:phenol hydroxylase [Providencia stuartii]|nr:MULTISPECIES: phenol hydroxylase [Providencia]MDI7245720.1 phenol hydroxylase [Providencia rettgeri]MDL9989663.1 phenol hydroxylase [Providencia rettgeri]MDN7225492.1 phenol hydroxylase [Providencia stuartii]